MAQQQDRALTAETVDREHGSGLRRLRFSAPVERLFLDEYLRRRARMVPLWALLGTLCYLAAILGDLSMMPDVAPAVVALRLGVFVPYALAVVLVMRRRPSAAAYDGLALGVGILGLSLPMGALVFSESPYLIVYQTGSVATLAFFAIVLRPRFRTALAGLAAMVAIQLAATALNGRFDAVTYAGLVTFYLTIGTFLALSAYFAERMDRLNFLSRLRGEALQAELARLSERDPLTGLGNRHGLDRFRDAMWTALPRTMAAIMIDLDHFKLYNDLHGHIDGDACIGAVARVVAEQAGARGHAFRYGGEEMLVLMPDADPHAAAALGEAIRRAVEALRIPHRGLPGGGLVTASLGVAWGRTDGCDFEALLRAADAALYEAKRGGGNRLHGDGAGFPAVA